MCNRVKKNVINDELDVHVIRALSKGRTLGKPGENDGFSRGWVGLSAVRYGSLEKLWGGGGGVEFLSHRIFFFRYQIRFMNFF